MPCERRRLRLRALSWAPATTPLGGVRSFHPNGGIIEARVLSHNGGTARAGFFDSQKQLAKAVTALDSDLSDSSIYVTLNPVADALRGRVTNRFGPAKRGRQTTDRDIKKRQWFAIDLDPNRPTNQLVKLGFPC